jgi:hypothetical protein
MRNPLPVLPLALVITAALAATGCGKSASPPEPTTTAPAPEAAVAEATPEAAPEAAADQAAAELAAREQELAAQAEELARREAELAEREAAAAQAAAARPAPGAKPAPAAKPPAAAKPTPAPAPAPAAPPPPPVTVAAGTQLSVNLEDAYSTKTNAVGQPVSARLASDLVAGGRVVARAGAPIRGTITEVTSGSAKIGAVPALKIDFTELVMADGSTMAINARINQKGQSEKGRDTAKIAGGTAAGAIIGHQINDGSGKVIGGIVGGAAGAIAAKKTGTEVEIPAGSVLQANLRSEFVYSGR